jgi:large subunit ribosomal protein L23
MSTSGLYTLIKRAVVTEKASDDTAGRNAYHFRVPTDASKIEIRETVERIFEVHVLSVNTMVVRGKERRRGYTAGRKPNWKKAMVTVAEGQTIDIF